MWWSSKDKRICLLKWVTFLQSRTISCFSHIGHLLPATIFFIDIDQCAFAVWCHQHPGYLNFPSSFHGAYFRLDQPRNWGQFNCSFQAAEKWTYDHLVGSGVRLPLTLQWLPVCMYDRILLHFDWCKDQKTHVLATYTTAALCTCIVEWHFILSERPEFMCSGRHIYKVRFFHTSQRSHHL